jgi:hypothetical protein
MNRKRRFRRGKVRLSKPPPPPAPLPSARLGPERVKLPTREMSSRPFASLQPLLWELQREIARGEEPVCRDRVAARRPGAQLPPP